MSITANAESVNTVRVTVTKEETFNLVKNAETLEKYLERRLSAMTQGRRGIVDRSEKHVKKIRSLTQQLSDALNDAHNDLYPKKKTKKPSKQVKAQGSNNQSNSPATKEPQPGKVETKQSKAAQQEHTAQVTKQDQSVQSNQEPKQTAAPAESSTIQNSSGNDLPQVKPAKSDKPTPSESIEQIESF